MTNKKSQKFILPSKIERPLKSGNFFDPKFEYLEHISRSKVVYFSSFDSESFFTQSKVTEGPMGISGHNILSSNVEATVAHCYTGSIMDEWRDDTPRIKDLKKQYFCDDIRIGHNAVFECVLDLIRHSILAMRNLEEIKRAYPVCRLSLSDQKRVSQATHCERCHIPFNDPGPGQSKGQTKLTRHHTHTSSPCVQLNFGTRGVGSGNSDKGPVSDKDPRGALIEVQSWNFYYVVGAMDVINRLYPIIL